VRVCNHMLAGGQLRIACLVRKSGPQPEDPLFVSFHPSCPHHDPQDRDSVCMRVRARLSAALLVACMPFLVAVGFGSYSHVCNPCYS